jgi:hypothetical protein
MGAMGEEAISNKQALVATVKLSRALIGQAKPFLSRTANITSHHILPQSTIVINL